MGNLWLRRAQFSRLEDAHSNLSTRKEMRAEGLEAPVSDYIRGDLLDHFYQVPVDIFGTPPSIVGMTASNFDTQCWRFSYFYKSTYGS